MQLKGLHTQEAVPACTLVLEVCMLAMLLYVGHVLCTHMYVCVDALCGRTPICACVTTHLLK